MGGVFLNMEFIGPLSSSQQALCPAFVDCTGPVSNNILLIDIVTVIALSIVALQSTQKVFEDRRVYKKEAKNGIWKISYFLGNLTSHIPSTIIIPFIFISLWYLFIAPTANFGTYFGVFLLIYFCWSGFGYLISIVLSSEHSLFFGSLFILFYSVISGYDPVFSQFFQNWYTVPFVALSPNRYALELLYLIELAIYRDVYLIDVSTALSKYGFNFANLWVDIVMLIIFGIFFRIVAFLLLLLQDPKIKNTLKYLIRISWKKVKQRVKINKKKEEVLLQLSKIL